MPNQAARTLSDADVEAIVEKLAVRLGRGRPTVEPRVERERPASAAPMTDADRRRIENQRPRASRRFSALYLWHFRRIDTSPIAYAHDRVHHTPNEAKRAEAATPTRLNHREWSSR